MLFGAAAISSRSSATWKASRSPPSCRRADHSNLSNVVELNINSFHFGPDLDFTEVLQDWSLENLLALSVSPCSLRRPSSLRRLAQICPNLADLDVRFGRKGGFVQCTGLRGRIPS
ncbi:hypothetical protein MTO96_050346 [Rhipicephalus appendiculatus]